MHDDGEIRREVLGRVPWMAPLHPTGSLITHENFWMLCKIMFLLENRPSKLNSLWYFFVYAGYFMFHNGFVTNVQCPTPRGKFGGKAGKCFPSWQKLTICTFLMSLSCTSKNSSRYQWHRKVYFKMPLHSLFLSWKSVSTKNAFGKGIQAMALTCQPGDVLLDPFADLWSHVEVVFRDNHAPRSGPDHPICLRILSKRSR